MSEKMDVSAVPFFTLHRVREVDPLVGAANWRRDHLQFPCTLSWLRHACRALPPVPGRRRYIFVCTLMSLYDARQSPRANTAGYHQLCVKFGVLSQLWRLGH